MLGNAIGAVFALAGQHPLLQAGAIIGGTFILEDAATVIAGMQAASGAIPIALALVSLWIGIVAGDLGLYGLGRLSASVPWIARLLPPHRTEAIRAWLHGRVFSVVLVSRFLPGVRLPTYTTCGFVGASLGRFLIAAVVATACWTTLLFAAAMNVGAELIAHLGAWRWAGAMGFVVFIIVAGRLAALGLQGERP